MESYLRDMGGNTEAELRSFCIRKHYKELITSGQITAAQILEGLNKLKNEGVPADEIEEYKHGLAELQREFEEKRLRLLLLNND